MNELLSFVQADFVETGAWLDNLNPRDGARINRVAEANEALLDQAVLVRIDTYDN